VSLVRLGLRVSTESEGSRNFTAAGVAVMVKPYRRVVDRARCRGGLPLSFTVWLFMSTYYSYRPPLTITTTTKNLKCGKCSSSNRRLGRHRCHVVQKTPLEEPQHHSDVGCTHDFNTCLRPHPASLVQLGSR
jgi:hypothetical protein